MRLLRRGRGALQKVRCKLLIKNKALCRKTKGFALYDFFQSGFESFRAFKIAFFEIGGYSERRAFGNDYSVAKAKGFFGAVGYDKGGFTADFAVYNG